MLTNVASSSQLSYYDVDFETTLEKWRGTRLEKWRGRNGSTFHCVPVHHPSADKFKVIKSSSADANTFSRWFYFTVRLHRVRVCSWQHDHWNNRSNRDSSAWVSLGITALSDWDFSLGFQYERHHAFSNPRPSSAAYPLCLPLLSFNARQGSAPGRRARTFSHPRGHREQQW